MPLSMVTQMEWVSEKPTPYTYVQYKSKIIVSLAIILTLIFVIISRP